MFCEGTTYFDLQPSDLLLSVCPGGLSKRQHVHRQEAGGHQLYPRAGQVGAGRGAAASPRRCQCSTHRRPQPRPPGQRQERHRLRDGRQPRHGRLQRTRR